MNKIKDFFHNSNDILLAILIILLAAGVIFWRMMIILDYPELVASQSNKQVVQEGGSADKPLG